MKKIISILIISIILSLIIKWNFIQGQAITVNQMMASALNSAGADIFSTSLNVWGRLNEKFGKSEMEHIVENIEKDLSIRKDSLDINKNYSDSLFQILARSQDFEGSIITVKIESLSSKGGNKENTLMVDVFHDGMFDVEKTADKIEKLFSLLKIQPNVNTCMVGTIKKKLSDDIGTNIERRVLSKFNAEYVKRSGLGGRRCVYAYSPIIDDSVQVENKAVNINFAYRYSSEEKKTYMWIATPVITME